MSRHRRAPHETTTGHAWHFIRKTRNKRQTRRDIEDGRGGRWREFSHAHRQPHFIIDFILIIDGDEEERDICINNTDTLYIHTHRFQIDWEIGIDDWIDNMHIYIYTYLI